MERKLYSTFGMDVHLCRRNFAEFMSAYRAVKLKGPEHDMERLNRHLKAIEVRAFSEGETKGVCVIENSNPEVEKSQVPDWVAKIRGSDPFKGYHHWYATSGYSADFEAYDFVAMLHGEGPLWQRIRGASLAHDIGIM